MGRHVALAAAALVSVGVFTWLAGPLLESQFGTEALIAAYAMLAVVAGGMTYVLIQARTRPANQTTLSDSSRVEATIELDEGLVDEEMQELKDRDSRQ